MIIPECEHCGCDESFMAWSCEKCGQDVALCTACNTIVLAVGAHVVWWVMFLF